MIAHHPIATTQKGTPMTPQTCTTCSGDGIDPEYDGACCPTCHGESKLPTAVRLAEIRARADAQGKGSPHDYAEFLAHSRQDVPWLLAEVDRLTGERDRARGLAARLEEQVARVEALAVAVDNRMMATAKPAEIWAALRGEGACEGSPLCPGETHTEGCYSLAWTDAERQQCTDSRCLTPCTECARTTHAREDVPSLIAEVERLRAVVARVEALPEQWEGNARLFDEALGPLVVGTVQACASRLRAVLTGAGGE